MTDDRQPTDWPDERLADAFLARAAARPTPPDLATATLERVRRSSGRSPARPSLHSLRAIGAAAAVVIVVAALAIGRPAVEPGQSPSIGPATTAPGLPVMSVEEAIAIRDADPTDREIAVRGYFSPAVGYLLCPIAGPPANPIRLDCPLQTQWLLDGAERLVDPSGVLPPGRAGFQVVLPFLDTSKLDFAGARERLDEVVFIGHFHDRRGHPNLCATGNDADCDGFVVDGIASVRAEEVQSSTVISLEPYAGEPRREPTWTPADVDRLLLAAAPNLEILSRVALPGHRIRELEPALGTGALGIIDRPVAWEVTGLDASVDATARVRRTFLIVDGTAEAYEAVPWEVDNVGFVPFALVPLPPAPSASPTSVTLDLVDHEGRHLSVEIIDESGLLLSAAPVPPGTPSDVPTPGNDVAVSQLAGQPNAIRLSWVGGVCDGPMRFTIRPDGRTIFQEALPREGETDHFCILLGISRSLTLTFSEPVPASEVEIVKVSARESPAPSGSSTVSTVVGEPMTVSEAIARRDNDLDDTEIAVRGFAWGPEASLDCAIRIDVSPAAAQCLDRHTFLSEETQRDASRQPTGAAIYLLIRPETYLAAGAITGNPAQVIVVGHFDDHRAAQCPVEQIESCRRNFIVDAVLDATQPGLDGNVIEALRPDPSVQPVAPAEWAGRVATGAPRGAGFILASFPVSGAAVTKFEPQAAESAELTSAAAVWIVRYIDLNEERRLVLKTKLIIDAPVDRLQGWIYIPSPDGLLREATIID